MSMSREQEEDDEHSLWQREDALCGVVLNEVFAWLSARDVCVSRGVCAAWRRAAAAHALWRDKLRRDARLQRTDLARLARTHVSWYEEYVKTFAGWDRRESVRCSGGGVVDAALDPADGARLALLTDDATLTIWRASCAELVGWRAAWRYAVRGWGGAARVLWAGSRLLLAGPLALSHHWELLVLQIDHDDDEDVCGHVVSRTRCSAGAAGCWADVAGETFLSFELNLFAPSVACTTVLLNSATQEIQSEHTGVRAPLFRIYNEDGEHFTLAVVIDTPLIVQILPPNTDHKRDHFIHASSDYSSFCTKNKEEEIRMRVLVTTSGCRMGGTVCAWGLSAARPPDVRATARGDLRERVRRAAAAPPPPPDAAPPAAHEVRALCTPPDDSCALPAPPVALAPHHSGRCVWVSLCSGEVWCLSSPTLRFLRRLAPLNPLPNVSPSDFLYYVRLAVSDEYVVSPAVGAGGVGVWRAGSGGAAPVTSLPALPAPALLALLPRTHAHTLLLFTSDTLHTIQPQLQRTCLRSTSRSCDGEMAGATRAPCESAPRPACRPPPPAAARRAERVACCAPPRARRPPCAPAPPPRPRTCAHVSNTERSSSPVKVSPERCGDRQDKVAVRLAAAEAARRADYESETRRGAGGGGAAAAPRLSLGEEQHCSRATDGRMYALPGAPAPLAACGPGRTPPPPHHLPLPPDDACRVNVDRYLDPCAHRPRKFVEIARGPPDTGGDRPSTENVSSTRSSALGDPFRIVDGPVVGRKCTSRMRSTPDKSDNSPRPRGFHSSSPFNAATEVAPEGIDNMLRERANLKEAGRGRVVSCAAAPGPAPPPPPGGHLELEVPPGAGRVSVRVTLSAACPPPASSCDTRAMPQPPIIKTISLTKQSRSIPGRKDSWLSSKCIQQKLSSPNESNDTVKGIRGNDVPKSPPPCPPKPPPSPPPPPTRPRQRPSCPPSSPMRSSNSSSDNKPGCKNISKFLPFVLCSV